MVGHSKEHGNFKIEQIQVDGKVFIPEKPREITSGFEVTLSIEPINITLSEKQKN